jgi:hypothetical protein
MEEGIYPHAATTHTVIYFEQPPEHPASSTSTSNFTLFPSPDAQKAKKNAAY